MSVRQAQPSDVHEVIPLLLSAIGDIGQMLAGTTDHAQMLDTLGQFFTQSGNRLSYENVYVLEREHQIAGFFLAYHGHDIAALDAPIIAQLREKGRSGDEVVPEARPNEYYLDSIAVSPNYQGQGIGTLLIAEFEQIARQLNHERLLLIVDLDNVRARALYERLGYTEDGSIEISSHLYDRMIKLLT
ncbi:GNAT family N-acetyltransferase [Paenibacillus sp. WLX2291]|uniref:GNAT family N-acetyltransferase n=1 Tax=Paenibacillus sp. WLX2291 TaxID=3296934 RepID=UPI00398432E0